MNLHKLSFLLFCALSTLYFPSCQKKTSYLDVIESACQGLKLSNQRYTKISDPSCGNTGRKAAYRIYFDFPADKRECIHEIIIEPRFYRANGSTISNVSYESSLSKNSPKVTINNGTANFLFEFEFATDTDADNMNHVYLKFFTRNEQQTESKNKLELRINGECSTVDPSTYTVTQTVNVSDNWVTIRFWDDAAEDGDIISVYLNGVWVLENYTLSNAGETFRFNIYPGNNHLVIYAVNEGTSGPNTLALSVNGGTEISMSPDLLTGQAINIKL
ncbi:MAG: hypothetical protein NZ529_06140 [Cytophagaceae bacterium]|nr:hypothetical protein [Cytophagaceae bacterium]MDW8456359.1 hypothetical protein [Cytophagaceae bacterium]